MTSNGLSLSERSITALANVIMGNPTRRDEQGRVSPYRRGPEIIAFFNDFGFNDSYVGGSGGPSRTQMAVSRIKMIKERTRLIKVIEEALAPSHFKGTEFTVEGAVAYLNPYLQDDSHDLVLQGTRYRVRSSVASSVAMEKSFAGSQEVNHSFIEDQSGKCDRKLAEGDYTGAITNARSLVEAVLYEMERRLVQAPPQRDGDLQKLYKRVRVLLNLDPKAGETQPFHSVLLGMTNVIDGLAPMRNSMSDAHALTYKPAKHHAKLAVNAAKTIADFVFDTYEYQLKAGWLKPVV